MKMLGRTNTNVLMANTTNINLKNLDVDLFKFYTSRHFEIT